MKLVFVTGLESIDKKSIINLALQRSGLLRKSRVVDFDSLSDMREEIKTAEEFESLQILIKDYYKKSQKILIDVLKEQKDLVIVDGCLTFRTMNHGYIQAMPKDFFETFKPSVMVILEKMPGVGQRLVPEVVEQQQVNRFYAFACSLTSGALLKIIKFREKRILDAVESLIGVLKY
ncbi:MAG: hypothetical protein J7K72_04590 [Candidatus Aenigmarchaeota archaeon]|nr:hypothetical protein [Candidatus Aenigmarchaeota archaeon]